MANKSAKIKNRNKKINPSLCTKCYQPTRIKFNFSFLIDDKGMTMKHKADLYDKLKEWSDQPFLVLSSWRKNKGFEYASKKKLGIKFDTPKGYIEADSHRKISDDVVIMRLYSNNNPECIRLIGEMHNKIYYIFVIDVGMRYYKH